MLSALTRIFFDALKPELSLASVIIFLHLGSWYPVLIIPGFQPVWMLN